MRFALREMASANPNEVRQILSVYDEKLMAMPGSPIRVQALLMAAIEGVRQVLPKELIVGVINRAFDESHIMLAAIKPSGVEVDPFEGESASERSARLQKYVEYLREQLDDDDLRALDDARLRQLR